MIDSLESFFRHFPIILEPSIIVNSVKLDGLDSSGLYRLIQLPEIVQEVLRNQIIVDCLVDLLIISGMPVSPQVWLQPLYKPANNRNTVRILVTVLMKSIV